MSLRDDLRLKRSSDLYEDAFGELVKCNPRENIQELALYFDTSQSTICSHSKKDKSEQAWRFGSS